MSLIEKIVVWSQRLPDWQSDALRRLWTQEEFNEADAADALIMLKLSHGIPSQQGARVPRAVRLSSDHVATRSSVGEDVVLLKSLSGVKGVNALVSDQHLNFGPEGITVIYGDNAAGKSGYSRVLKRACRARSAEEVIHPNVFETTTPPLEATATFGFQVAGTETTSVEWNEGRTPPAALANIAVFDSACARVYVDEENEVAYIPYGLDLLTDLAELCTELRTQLQKEVENLPDAPSVLPELVGEGKIIERLSADTKGADIEKLATFTSEDASKLAEISALVVELTANDPQKKAQALIRQKGRIDQLRRELYNLKAAISRKNLTRLRALQESADGAADAAKLASERAFENEPLDGTGSEAWYLMFNAAKRFSEENAYPEEQFPVTAPGSRCLLCQQELQEEARDRIDRFWQFIQADTAKMAEERRTAFQDAATLLSSMDLDPEERDPQLLDELREISTGTAESLVTFLSSVRGRATAATRACNDRLWEQLPTLTLDPSPQMSRLSKRLLLEASKAEEHARKGKKEKAELEKSRLEALKLLSENKDAILGYISRLDLERRLKACYAEARTTGITRKQSELMEEALTADLKEAIDDELTGLGLDYISLKLKTAGTVGSTLHQLRLAASEYERVDLSEILSEGEHRVVAIGSFLAELRTTSHRCGIVFDDPVSSLDHKWRERVAKRLVTEGKTRQVIIFTHDIVFLYALHHEAAVEDVPFLTQTVSRRGRDVGLCSTGVPWDAMSVNKRVRELNAACQYAGSIYRNGDLEGYGRELERFYGRLREAWEKAVEDILLGDVVQRFRHGIETQKLHSVDVTDEDYEKVYRAIEKCSIWLPGHARAGATGTPSLPEPVELESDIAELDSYLKVLDKRRGEVRKRRRRLLKPPGGGQ